VLPPGDLRRCLVALANDDLWARTFEHRFAAGELDGHALGNLVLVALTETTGDFTAALDAAGRLLGTVGRVLPATTEPVVLKAEVGLTGAASATEDDVEEVEGQVAVQNSRNIRRVELVPADASAPAEAVRAIETADQVVLAPGSLYTSLLPVLCVDNLRQAIAGTRGTVVQVANLRPQPPETSGLDGTGHLRAVHTHGVRVDVFLSDAGGVLAVDDDEIRAMRAVPMTAQVAADRGLTHDSERLARALQPLVERAGSKVRSEQRQESRKKEVR
jgi:uncharacterized cofD-like protein